MTQATDKQIYFLKGKGIDATNLSKEAASEIIKNIKESPGSKVVQQPEIEKFLSAPAFKKTTYDKSSYYVSYAKDVFIQLLACGEPRKLSEEEVKKLMNLSISVIKQAKEAF